MSNLHLALMTASTKTRCACQIWDTDDTVLDASCRGNHLAWLGLVRGVDVKAKARDIAPEPEQHVANAAECTIPSPKCAR
jgi:hypothetical protein